MKFVVEGELVPRGYTIFPQYGIKQERFMAVTPAEEKIISKWEGQDFELAQEKPKKFSEYTRKKRGYTRGRLDRHGYKKDHGMWEYHYYEDIEPKQSLKEMYPRASEVISNYSLTNPCKEITLEAWDDYCNLGEDNMPKQTDLYEITQELGTKVFGTYLATNSDGKYVFEVKGSGEYIAVDKDKAERVMPYTVVVQFLNSTENAKSYAYLSEKGKVKKGDLLIVNNSLATVQDVDTKSELATKELTGYKLQTETI